MTDLIGTGPHRCQLCNRPVTVVYDPQANWAYAKECGHTITPKHMRLTAKDRQGLIAFKIFYCDRQGFTPRATRTQKELGRGEDQQ